MICSRKCVFLWHDDEDRRWIFQIKSQVFNKTKLLIPLFIINVFIYNNDNNKLIFCSLLYIDVKLDYKSYQQVYLIILLD